LDGAKSVLDVLKCAYEEIEYVANAIYGGSSEYHNRLNAKVATTIVELMWQSMPEPERAVVTTLLDEGFFSELREHSGWPCDDHTFRNCEAILQQLGYEQERLEKVLEVFRVHGGSCDCRVLDLIANPLLDASNSTKTRKQRMNVENEYQQPQ
jgi:hypothetical protein